MILGKHIAYVFTFFFSLVLAFFVANSDYHERPGSDLPAYEQFYNCLDGDSIRVCRVLISSNYEYLFYVVFLIPALLGVEFTEFLFVFSFAIYFILASSVIRLSKNEYGLYWLSLIFLISDFRFYDYGFNILRHGFAAALMIFFTALLGARRRKLWFFTSFLPVLVHVTAIAQLSLLSKFKLLYSRFTWLAILMSTFLFVQFFYSEWVLNYIFQLEYFGDKVYYYFSSDREHDWVPVQYVVSIVAVLLVRIDDTVYIRVRQVFFVLVALSILLLVLGMSYRMVAFMMPFVAVLISYQVYNFLLFFTAQSRVIVYISLLIVFMLYAGVYLYNYRWFVLGGLQ